MIFRFRSPFQIFHNTKVYRFQISRFFTSILPSKFGSPQTTLKGIQTIKMGQTFGTSSNTNTEYTSKSIRQSSSLSGKEVKSAKLISPPSATLLDPIHLRVVLDKDTCAKWRQQQGQPMWYVELEIDIAYLQERHQICAIPTTNLDDGVMDVYIPSAKIADVVNDKSLESLCNVCAMRIWLQNELDGRRLINEIVLVFFISHGGYDKVESVSKLSRDIYGVESDSARPR